MDKKLTLKEYATANNIPSLCAFLTLVGVMALLAAWEIVMMEGWVWHSVGAVVTALLPFAGIVISLVKTRLGYRKYLKQKNT